jgi:hypothetical protein
MYVTCTAVSNWISIPLQEYILKNETVRSQSKAIATAETTFANKCRRFNPCHIMMPFCEGKEEDEQC